MDNFNPLAGARRWPLACVVVLTASLVGCASSPKTNAELQETRAVFERVEQNEIVARYAAQELGEARTSLAQADKLWRKKESKTEVNHAAYLARQSALIAEKKAIAEHAKVQSGELRLQRSQTVAELKTAEADNLRVAAAQAQASADRLSLEARRLEQEVADREAELQRKQQELAELKELQAKQTDRGMVLTLGDVLFDINKSTLKVGAIKTLDKVAAFMHKYPERSVLIEGHTDNIGEEDYNQELSVNRALAIRGALVARGIDMSRIATEGLGESAPIASNDSAAGRQLNRRVEMIFENPQQTVTAGIEE